MKAGIQVTALYEYWMRAAQSYEQLGNFADAADSYLRAAYERNVDPLHSAIALKGAGKSLHLLGRLERSHHSFGSAHTQASLAYALRIEGSQTELDRIGREWAVLYAACGYYPQALEIFRETIEGQHSRHETAEEGRSESCRADVYVTLDEFYQAYRGYDRAYALLLRHPDAWLDSVMCFMRILGIYERLPIGIRAIVTAVKIGRRRDAIRVIALMTGYGTLRLYREPELAH